MPQQNEQIGPYTLVRQLGRGAFGIVWLAERRSKITTTKVALKLSLDEDPDLDAIKQEADLWVNASAHPNILPIIEADVYQDQIIIVSEYAPDGSLDGWLAKYKGAAPSTDAAIKMICGILAGLEHLHSRRIIHRDLKPANILLQGETPRLADFGLARVLKSSAHTAGIAGTPVYMSPETFEGKRSEQSDIWSVGVIFYKLLTGRVPFPQTDLMALIGAIANRAPEPLPDHIPEDLQKIVLRTLEKETKDRYPSVRAMLQEIEQLPERTRQRQREKEEAERAEKERLEKERLEKEQLEKDQQAEQQKKADQENEDKKKTAPITDKETKKDIDQKNIPAKFVPREKNVVERFFESDGFNMFFIGCVTVMALYGAKIGAQTESIEKAFALPTLSSTSSNSTYGLIIFFARMVSGILHATILSEENSRLVGSVVGHAVVYGGTTLFILMVLFGVIGWIGERIVDAVQSPKK